MSAGKQVSTIFTQNYSLPKALFAEALLLIGAVLPLVPTFAAQAHYTRFLYAWPFFPIVILSCLLLGLLSLAMIPVLWRALRHLPAIEISGEQIVVHSNRQKRAELSEIASLTPAFGNVMIELRNGKKIAAPVLLCEQPSATLTHLLAVGPAPA